MPKRVRKPTSTPRKDDICGRCFHPHSCHVSGCTKTEGPLPCNQFTPAHPLHKQLAEAGRKLAG